jgi:pimeloyl-ACP methyl ester carboxylesterase
MATFCLLHGAWHDASSWDPLMDPLRERGHDPRAPELPLHEAGSSHEDRVRPAIEAVEDVSEPVVVVGHSQSSSLGPLVAAGRPAALIVHLCPRRLGPVEEAPPGAPRPFRETLPMPQLGEDGTSSWDPETAVTAMYPRLPAESARALAGRLRPMAMPADDYPLASHPDVPTALIYAANDEFFEPDWERFMARELLGVEPIELPTGHFPMVEDPERLADVLDGLAPA